VQRIKVLQDWIRVEDLEVEAGEHRTYEFHVVQDPQVGRVTLTIKCLDGRLDGKEQTVRLDPTVINAHPDRFDFPQLAERRIRHLYAKGMI
jgi:hypothetical protein